jgi:6-phosphofructokinase 2
VAGNDTNPTSPGALITVTLNPALDVSTSVDVVAPEHKLRCEPVVREPGGGGVNVARVASRLGIETKAAVVIAGTTGQQLVDLAHYEGLTLLPVHSDGETRQSLTVAERSTGRHYRFVLPGSPIAATTMWDLLDLLVAQLPVACVVISGSVPPDAPAGLIPSLCERLPGTQIIIDTSGQPLAEALRTTATMVKPSARELSWLTDRELLTEADVLDAAHQAQASASIGSMLVSIGAGGAILVRSSGPPVRFRAPTVQVQSTVGAGDSLVAGVATGLCRGLDLVGAAALGVAAGTAAVMTPGSELARPSTVEELLPLVTME